MEHYLISKLLNNSTVPKLVTRKWIKVNGLSGGQNSANKNIRFKTPMLRSDLWDNIDAYIIIQGIVSVTSTNNVKRRNRKVTFKNNAPFRSCISKINNTFVDNSEDLDIVMVVYNLFECNNNYSMTSANLWN